MNKIFEANKMNSFGTVQHILSVVVMALFGIIIGLALIPSYFLFFGLTGITDDQGAIIKIVGICIALGLGYILWGVTLILICGMIGALFKIRKPEGRYPLRSLITIQWGLSMVSHRVAQLFLKQIVPSFLANIYYRMMGAKIGKGVQLNSEHINDASMITFGDRVVVGGHATINGHLVESGELVLAPVSIGDDVLIGGGSVVQPGCIIGDGAVVGSRAVVPKWTKIPPGEIWAGVPAKCIRLADGTKPK